MRWGNRTLFLFRSRPKIAITIKLFGGLDTFAGIKNYDPDLGIPLEVPENIRLGKLVKKLGLGKTGSISLFVNGNPANLKERLQNGDIIFCMRPMAGG
jgi:sulfur carrier protein ThiS